MRYLTDRKRAAGQGASGTGTEHHWAMQVSAVALALLVPVWLWIFGSALGKGREEVIATFASPFAAILTALVLIVGMRHFIGGATIMIEDYARGMTRKLLVLLVHGLGWSITASGIFAVARMAL